jgi:solute carrier family 31 (copper transporter), member 1
VDVVVSLRLGSIVLRKGPTTLRNTQIIDTCVVFKSWHIRSNAQFMLSCIAIVLLGIFFEWLRCYARRVDRKILAKAVKGRIRLGNSRDGSRERNEDPPK